jgi:cytochrome P450
MNPFNIEIPAHVPPGLVIDFPLSQRATTYEHPFEVTIPRVHEGPVAFMAPRAFQSIAPSWIFRRARDARQIFGDVENFSKKGSSSFAAMIGEDWDSIPTELDPPRHTSIRRALNPLFTPNRMALLEDKVRRTARDCLSRFKDQGHCDFVQDFAVPYPVSIFLDLIGLPQERTKQFLEWEYCLIHAPAMEERAAGVRAVKACLLEAIEERRTRPRDDLISTALRLIVDGKPLSPIEVFGHCFNLYIGGLDTVTASIGWHFLHLATHVEQQRQLRNDPSLIPAAMNELLRAYSTTSHIRTCVKEIEIAGITIRPGEKILISNPVVNRDPEEFDQPNEVRFDRGATNLLSFGHGVHNCLGRHLARREVQVALEEVLATLPEFRIKPGARVPFRIGGVLHTAELPLEWS